MEAGISWICNETHRQYILHNNEHGEWWVTARRTDTPEEGPAVVEHMTGRPAERLADRIIWTSRHRGSETIPQELVDWAFSVVKKDHVDPTQVLINRLDRHVHNMVDDDTRLASWCCGYLRRMGEDAKHRTAVSYMLDAVEVLLNMKEADEDDSN